MNSFIFIYNEALWRPLFNGLVWLYAVIPGKDMGLAIIVFTVAVRLVLFPLFWKTQKSQRAMAALQPELKKIQERFKNSKEAQAKAVMEFYAKHKTNPFSGCLVILAQFPVMIAIFQIFQSGLKSEYLSYLYSFVPNPGELNPVSFGMVNLAEPNVYLGAMAALTQFGQAKISTLFQKKNAGAKNIKADMASAMQWQAVYFFPVLIFVFSLNFPAALPLYWTVFNIFAIFQEIAMKKEKIFAPEAATAAESREISERK